MLKKKPHVIVEVERMKHPYTGLYYFCLQLSRALYDFHRHEMDFTFFKYPGVYFPEDLPAVNRKQWDKIFLYKDWRYDIWHGTWQLTKYVPKGKIKFVYTIHDLNFLYTDKPELKKKRLLQQIQERIDRADMITVISDYVRRDVEQHLDTHGKPVRVIYNGVEVKRFPEFDAPRYRPEKPFLFTVGTVLYKKHFHVLPRLLPGTDFELIIAGIHPDKEYVEQIRAQARKFGVENRVILTGPVSDEEKYWYMSRAEAFLFPSISEGFGMPPVEAMRLGKPVFLSTHTSLPEVGGHVAYYFQNFEPEHMREVLLHGLEDYQKNNRKEEIIRWSNKFTWKNAARNYVAAYFDVLNGKVDIFETKAIPAKTDRRITAIIPTKNEEENIADAIKSVQWADEILVVDSISDDRTVEIARKMGARVIQRQFDDFSSQKNFAIEQAKHDWIFVLDADERVPEELRDEILQIMHSTDKHTAYWIKRINFVGKHRIRFSGWQNDKCIRLFHRDFARYNGHYVHEEIKNNGKTGFLKNPMFHYTYKSFEQFENKLDFYARLRAREWFEQGRKYRAWRQFIKSVYRFFKHYILHLGFLDGRLGWRLARHYSKATWKRYGYLKAMEKKHGK